MKKKQKKMQNSQAPSKKDGKKKINLEHLQRQVDELQLFVRTLSKRISLMETPESIESDSDELNMSTELILTKMPKYI